MISCVFSLADADDRQLTEADNSTSSVSTRVNTDWSYGPILHAEHRASVAATHGLSLASFADDWRVLVRAQRLFLRLALGISVSCGLAACASGAQQTPEQTGDGNAVGGGGDDAGTDDPPIK